MTSDYNHNQAPAVERRLIMYSVASVSVFAIIYCKQGISKPNLWTFAKLPADTPYTLPWKRLTSGADHIQHG